MNRQRNGLTVVRKEFYPSLLAAGVVIITIMLAIKFNVHLRGIWLVVCGSFTFSGVMLALTSSMIILENPHSASIYRKSYMDPSLGILAILVISVAAGLCYILVL